MDLNLNLKIDVYHHVGDSNDSATILELLNVIKAQGEKIMSAQDDALAAIAKIDAATTKQGAAIQVEADNLQTISTHLDNLIIQLGTSVPAPVLAGLKAVADKAQAISDSLDAQAAFSTSLATKGVIDPVPIPVPDPTPTPTPTPTP